MSADSSAGRRPFRWTLRAFALWVSGAVLLAFGVLLTVPALLFVGLPILVAPVAAALLAPEADPPLELRWSAGGHGPHVEVEGEIRVDPSADPADLEVAFSVPPGLVERGRPEVARVGDRIRFRLDWEAPNPVVVPAPRPRVVWRDPVGLVERSVSGELPELVIERYPPEILRIGAVRLERTIALPGEVRSRRLGSSGEFYGLREATPTEPPRRINWIATARRGHPVANDFRVDRTGDLVLVVDARATSLGPRRDAETLALSVAAASGIGESFLREKARVGLGVFGEFLDAVPLGSGRTQRIRLRRALLAARVASTPGPSERCAVAMRRFFPTGVTTIVLSSLADTAGLDLVAFLRRRGYPVTILSPSPLSPRAPDAAPGPAELADRIARLVRRARIAHAWQEARVVDWEDRWSLAPLVALLRRPDDRRRVA